MEQDVELTNTERRILDILKEKEIWTEWEVKRNSEREFDIHIDGKRNIGKVGECSYGFSSWMPLAIIYNINWADSKIWKLSNGYGEKGYIPCQGYDWSGIRDSSEDAIWQMTKVAIRMMGIYRAGK